MAGAISVSLLAGGSLSLLVATFSFALDELTLDELTFDELTFDELTLDELTLEELLLASELSSFVVELLLAMVSLLFNVVVSGLTLELESSEQAVKKNVAVMAVTPKYFNKERFMGLLKTCDAPDVQAFLSVFVCAVDAFA